MSHAQELQFERSFAWAVELGQDDSLELSEDGLSVKNRQYHTVAEQQASNV